MVRTPFAAHHLSQFIEPQHPSTSLKKMLKINDKLRTDNGEAMRDACVQGITINSSWSAYQQLRSGELVHILKDYPLVSNIFLLSVLRTDCFRYP
ncbi:hypothetical protein [Gilvimarinus sp. 1_MG-2023]|uniref:hypothetical protein n=1 Tax=Gilvimarinus sp. 1_MG-2023 TaxID=3062638 RepID=UPI0026E25AB2|nr:hypothetical protein [Gilvimarinus sp. 1_MG-2023]MDO6748059.1 hypothetical protein [Gilvimarinus sp. 1_MG-2023]